MVQFRWIRPSLFVIAMLLLTAVTRQSDLFLPARAGDEVTLPCDSVQKSQSGCKGTSWHVSHYEGAQAKELVHPGKPKPDRLSLAANCSLVIKHVTAEDVGRYTCREYNSNEQQKTGEARVSLSVIDITEYKDESRVTLSCSMLEYSCKHTVKWLFKGREVSEDYGQLKTSQLSSCTMNVTFTRDHFISGKDYDLLKCNITNNDNKEVHQFTFRSQTSGEKQDEDADESTDSTTTRAMGKNWWWYVLAAVGAAALLMVVVAGVKWRRTKANKTGHNANDADPENGLHYSTVSYTKKPDSKARVRGKHDNDGDTVTYSMVKVSARVSEDPSNLYATVNVPNK